MAIGIKKFPPKKIQLYFHFAIDQLKLYHSNWLHFRQDIKILPLIREINELSR